MAMTRAYSTSCEWFLSEKHGTEMLVLSFRNKNIVSIYKDCKRVMKETMDDDQVAYALRAGNYSSKH